MTRRPFKVAMLDEIAKEKIDEITQQLEQNAARHREKAEHYQQLADGAKRQQKWFKWARLPLMALLPVIIAIMWGLTRPFSGRHRVYHRVSQWLHRRMIRITGIQVTVKNLNTSPLPQCVFISNANDAAPLVTQAYLPYQFRMVVDYQLFERYDEYFLAYMMKESRYLPIDASHLQNLYRDMKRMTHFLDHGHSLAFAIQQSDDYYSPTLLLKHHALPFVPVYVQFDSPIQMGYLLKPVTATVIIGKPVNLAPELLQDREKRPAVESFIRQHVHDLQQML